MSERRWTAIIREWGDLLRRLAGTNDPPRERCPECQFEDQHARGCTKGGDAL